MVQKGQVIGGSGQVQGAAPRRKGGMLPPTGAGPVEVTPEWIAEQQRAVGQPVSDAAPEAAEILPEQKAEKDPLEESPALPDPDADPADQLAVCERGIHHAKARWKEKVDGATEAFIDEAGPFLAWVHENKLYKLMLDGTGRPYRSFAKYLKERHDLSRRTGYRITQTIPLLNLLKKSNVSLPDLSARQVDALHPVRVQHGPVAVLKVWWTASETKKGPLPTPEELEKAKQLLGLSTKPDPDEEAAELASGAADAGAAVERAAKLLVPETVREAVKKDPDRVRLLHQVLGAALSEAGVLPSD
jgi:hypothetical protein